MVDRYKVSNGLLIIRTAAAYDKFDLQNHEVVFASDFDQQVDAGMKLFNENERLRARIATLEGALMNLLPGLEIDLRYADADDEDMDALRSRVKTVRDALYPTLSEGGK